MGYDKTAIFQPLGKAVKRHRLISGAGGFMEQLDGVMGEMAALLNDSQKEREALYAFSAANHSDAQSLAAMANRVVSATAAFLTGVVRHSIGAVGTTPQEVLEELAEAMRQAGDTVCENTVTVSGPTADPDNAGNGYIADLTVTQNARDDNHFEAECIDASQEGAEQWRISCSRLGELGIAITGQVFTCEDAGVSFTITARDEIEEQNDDNDQLENWSFSGAQKGVNTDQDGRLYVTLTDSGGTRTVSCYKDPDRTELVCQGSREGDGTIELVEQNNSGLSGSVDVTYTQDDNDIVVILPFAFDVGDKFRFSTQISAQGKFQYFFVENFGVALPSASAGNETVPESWAE